MWLSTYGAGLTHPARAASVAAHTRDFRFVKFIACSSLHLESARPAGGRTGLLRRRLLSLLVGCVTFHLSFEEELGAGRFDVAVGGQRVVGRQRLHQARRDNEHEFGLVVLELAAAEQCPED